MPLKFFVVPIQCLVAGEAEVNAFLRSNRVLAVDRRWVDLGPASYWALCVDYLDSPAVGHVANFRSQGSKSRVDYKEVLSPDDFQMFSELRSWRKRVAAAEAVPVYTVFTNEQLAEIVRHRAANKGDLERIAGVGDARVEKYGPGLLEFFASIARSNNETREPSI